LWFTAAAFVGSAVLVAMLRVPDAGRPAAPSSPSGYVSGTLEGLRYVWSDRLLRSLTVMTALLVSVYLPVEGVLLPVEFEARGQPGRLGVVVMAMSAGGIVGALGYGLWAKRLRRSLVFRSALVLTAGFLLVLAVLPPFPAMIVASVGIGLAYGPVGPVVNLALQTRSTEQVRGRVIGIITSAEYAAGPLGYLLVGAATERFGVAPTFLALALVLLGVALAGLVVRPLSELDDLPSAVPAATSWPEAVEQALDAATAGPLPLVQPPREPTAGATGSEDRR
jgi:predicted MFS family arabinose efflux permease